MCLFIIVCVCVCYADISCIKVSNQLNSLKQSVAEMNDKQQQQQPQQNNQVTTFHRF